MSLLRDQLLLQLQRFDEDAFVALANRGLLRRAQKDLEKQAPTIAEDSDTALVLVVGEQRVTFDGRGVAQARCSCPSSTVCQHILAAALGLQALATSTEKPPETVVESAPAEAPLQPLHAALMAMPVAALLQHAGKAGYRWAWQFVQDLDAEQALRVSGGQNVLIGFMHPRMNFRYVGGGPDSLIIDVNVSQPEKYQVAAVLAYQKINGAVLEAPEPTARARTGALDLGKDHALPEEGLDDSRLRLRAAVRQLLLENIGLGLSHLSAAVQERYATLAVWAQGCEYYRLALLLRRLADHVELLLERAGNADERRLFDELTLVFGLVEALTAAAAQGMAPARLLGRARSRYEESGMLALLGLGAMAWRSASGYVGLTMIFWSPADGTFMSCSDARPELQRGFDPRARYKAAGPWGGLRAPAQATGSRLHLTGAQMNAQGRLSAADSTSVMVQAVASAQELVGLLRPVESWAGLGLAAERNSLLAEPQPMLDWTVLKPARFGPPVFDATQQTLVWPLFDGAGQPLLVTLPHAEYTRHAIERIEQTQAQPLPAGTLLVARIVRAPAGLLAEPLSLIYPDAPAGKNPVDCLHFDAAPSVGFVSTWAARLRQVAAGQRAEARVPVAAAVPPLLGEFRHWLQQQAERGADMHAPLRLEQELGVRCERLQKAGFSAFAPAQVLAEAAGRLLETHYLCMQYERLLGGSVSEEL